MLSCCCSRRQGTTLRAGPCSRALASLLCRCQATPVCLLCATACGGQRCAELAATCVLAECCLQQRIIVMLRAAVQQGHRHGLWHHAGGVRPGSVAWVLVLREDERDPGHLGLGQRHALRCHQLAAAGADCGTPRGWVRARDAAPYMPMLMVHTHRGLCCAAASSSMRTQRTLACCS